MSKQQLQVFENAGFNVIPLFTSHCWQADSFNDTASL